MGIFDTIFKILNSQKDSKNSQETTMSGRIKNAGGYDHRGNTGNNRTSSQKDGDYLGITIGCMNLMLLL